MNRSKKLELYLHIPFCQQKCRYCDFLSAPADAKVRERYVDALIREIKEEASGKNMYSVPSIFIGGGTPSVLEGEAISRIMEAVNASFLVEKDAEITIECNPGTLNKEKLTHYKQAGINRISLGLQSCNNEELKLLGRIHTFAQFLESFDLIRKAGFSNVNIDLMSGLPGQQLVDWQENLKTVVSLQPEHISAYSLIIEEGTPFYEQYGEDEMRRAEGEEPCLLPTEETERAMYEWTKEFLREHGYGRYEISNYAKAGRECRHNIGYWKRENYLGLGLGSASLVENVRYSNTRDLKEYLSGTFEKQEYVRLDRQAQMEEFMFLGLRMTQGIARQEFLNIFQKEVEAVYGDEISRLYKQGLLVWKEGYLSLTEEGISVSNFVLSEFLK